MGSGPLAPPPASATAERLIDEFAALGPVEAKKMFGGYGLFCEAVMFALIDTQGICYLRAEGVDQKFESRGGQKHGRMPYWSIPAEVLNNPDELGQWAADALAVARAQKRK